MAGSEALANFMGNILGIAFFFSEDTSFASCYRSSISVKLHLSKHCMYVIIIYMPYIICIYYVCNICHIYEILFIYIRRVILYIYIYDVIIVFGIYYIYATYV